MEAQGILTKLEGVRKTGGGWQARCPAHEDRQASLSISTGDDGRVLLHCHAGWTVEAVVGKVGLPMRDLMPTATATAGTPATASRRSSPPMITGTSRRVTLSGRPVRSKGLPATQAETYAEGGTGQSKASARFPIVSRNSWRRHSRR